MVDRIQNINPQSYRVDETLKDQERKKGPGQEEQEDNEDDGKNQKKEDKFSKQKKDVLKNIASTNPKIAIGVPDTHVFEKLKKETSDPRIPLEGNAAPVNHLSGISDEGLGKIRSSPELPEMDDEITLDVTEVSSVEKKRTKNFLLSSGLMTIEGKPRVRLLITYIITATILVVSTIFLMRLLWT